MSDEMILMKYNFRFVLVAFLTEAHMKCSRTLGEMKIVLLLVVINYVIVLIF